MSFSQEAVDIMREASLQMGFKAGVASERERIIELLEEMAKSTFPGDVWNINPFDYAIALIKGEQK